MTYQLTPGTLPHRAHEHLKSTGEAIAAAPLAEELGTDTSTLINSLKTAVHHGVIDRHKTEGRVYYQIGNGTPAERQPEENEPEEPLVNRPRRGAKAAPSVANVFDLGGAQSKAPEPAPEPYTNAPLRGPFKFAYHSDRTMLLIKNGASMQLDAAETRALIEFAARMNW